MNHNDAREQLDAERLVSIYNGAGGGWNGMAAIGDEIAARDARRDAVVRSEALHEAANECPWIGRYSRVYAWLTDPARAAVVDPTAKDHDIAGYGCRKCGLRTADIAPDSDCVRVVDPRPTKTEDARLKYLNGLERMHPSAKVQAVIDQMRAEIAAEGAGGGES